jgi:hypothetical protein
MTIKAQQAFARMGSNFMTPDVIRYQDLDNGLMVELSEGTGFDGQPIFGVTVLNADKTPNHEACEMFQSLKEAEQHIDGLEDE